jgi:putative membrane protein
MAFSAILASIFAYWMLFFTDLGKAWLQMPWMHVKLGFVFALYLYHGNANKFSINCKMTKLNTQPILCAYGTKELPSFFFCGSLLVVLKMPLIDLRSYWNFYIALTIMLGFKFYKRIRKSISI